MKKNKIRHVIFNYFRKSHSLRIIVIFATISFMLIAFIVLPSHALAQDGDPTPSQPVILTEELEKYPLGLNLEILEDPGGELTIDEVVSAEFDSLFVNSEA